MFRVLLILTALLLTSACRKLPRAPRFAIELPAEGSVPASRVIVDEGLGSDSQFPIASLPAASPGAQGLAGWETLELNYSTEGDKVKVTVFALHKEYDARRHATIFRSQKLGAHAARLAESVRLAELEKFGYSPFTLRVVPAK
jgi:hypothetical protein